MTTGVIIWTSLFFPLEFYIASTVVGIVFSSVSNEVLEYCFVIYISELYPSNHTIVILAQINLPSACVSITFW